MEITEIKPLKTSGLFAVYADYEYLAAIDDETIYHAGIKVGASFTQVQLDEIIEKSQKKRAKAKALRLLSFRDHSKRELQKKLVQTAGEEAAEEAANRMEELGLIDDANYAKKWVNEMMQYKLFAKDRVVFELMQKGIDKETILEAIENIDIDPYEQVIILLNKKYPRGFKNESDKRRANAMLSRYGYKWDAIKHALASFETEDQDVD